MGQLLGNDPTQFRRMRETPLASAALGPVVRLVGVARVPLRFRGDAQGRDDGGVEPAPDRDGDRARKSISRSSAAGGCTPRSPASSTRSSTPKRRCSTRSAASSPTCRATTTRRRPTRRCPPARARTCATSSRSCPQKPHAGLRHEARHPRDRRQGHVVRAEAALRQERGDRARAPRRQERRASSPTIRCIAAARSTRMRAARSSTSWCCAIRSTCRS